HWQYAHRQFRQRMRLTKGKGRRKGKRRVNKKVARKDSFEKNADDFNHVEYLSAADTVGLLQKSDLVRIATILDPRFKDFKWDNTGKKKDKSRKLLQIQYDFAKEYFYTRNVYSQPIQQTTSIHNCADDDDNFFKALEHKELD
ncbi:28780_t:CDS:2, partial [Gigaspora margarita]